MARLFLKNSLIRVLFMSNNDDFRLEIAEGTLPLDTINDIDIRNQFYTSVDVKNASATATNIATQLLEQVCWDRDLFDKSEGGHNQTSHYRGCI